MPELTAAEPGDYLLSHTPDGLVMLIRRDGGDLEVIGVVVPYEKIQPIPANAR